MIINCPGRVEAGGGASIARSLSLPILQLGTARSGEADISRTRLCTKLGSAIGGAKRGAAAPEPGPSPRGGSRRGEGAGPPGRGRELRAAGRPGWWPGVRQRREPRSFPVTRRAELRAGPGLSQSLPPRPDAQTWAGCTDGRLAERTAGRCARCDPGAGTRVAAVSWASAASLGECRKT